MVKIPNFGELKKMSEGLANSAKGNKIFDKLKSSVDSLGAGSVDQHQYGEASTPLARSLKLLNELQEIRRMEANAFNNLKAEIMLMAKKESELNAAQQAVDEKSAEETAPEGSREPPKQ